MTVQTCQAIYTFLSPSWKSSVQNLRLEKLDQSFHVWCWKMANHTLKILWCEHHIMYIWSFFNIKYEKISVLTIFLKAKAYLGPYQISMMVFCKKALSKALTIFVKKLHYKYLIGGMAIISFEQIYYIYLFLMTTLNIGK